MRRTCARCSGGYGLCSASQTIRWRPFAREGTELHWHASAARRLSRAHTSSSDDAGWHPVRIALFVTCIGDTLFPDAGRATVQVLERLGHEVVFPEEQTCCGQMHLNSGYAREARKLGRRFTEIFGGVRRGGVAVVLVCRDRAGDAGHGQRLRAVRVARAAPRCRRRRCILPGPRRLPLRPVTPCA